MPIIISDKDLSKVIDKNMSHDDNITIYIYIEIDKLLKLIPSHYNKMILTFHNKLLFNKLMTNNNLQNHVPELISQFPPTHYPCLVKPIIGLAGRNTYIVNNIDEWKTIKPDTKFNLIQKYIFSNILYACHLLCKNGDIILAKVYYEPKDTNSYVHCGPLNNPKSRNINDDELILFSKIIKLNNYHCMCCIDYVYEEDTNVIKIFEINPRTGGSLLASKNDFDLFINTIVDKKIFY